MEDKTIQKIGVISGRRGLSPVSREIKLKGIHLPTVELALGKRLGKGFTSIKGLKKVTVREESECKKVPLLRAAYDAYKCCQNQDLHLFQLQKIYLEKKFLLKGVVGWKLPKKRVVQQRLRAFVDGMRFNPEAYKSHLVTWLAKVKSSDEKAIQEHLEMQNQRKDSRNYSASKPLFQ